MINKMRRRSMVVLVGMVACGGSGNSEEGNEANGEEGEQDPAWIARARVGQMDGNEFVTQATLDFAEVADNVGEIGLVQARFDGTSDIVVGLPTTELRRMNPSLEDVKTVDIMGRWGVDALDLDGDGLDEVVNYDGTIDQDVLVILPGTANREDWGEAQEHSLGYRPAGLALVPASASQNPGIAICYRDLQQSTNPATLLVLEWDGTGLAQRWRHLTERSWCGPIAVAQVGGEPVIVMVDDRRTSAFYEGEDAPFATIDRAGRLAVADQLGDEPPMIVIDTRVSSIDEDTRRDEIAVVSLGEEGFGDAVTMDSEWAVSLSTGDVDGDGADEILVAHIAGTLDIIELVGDELVVSTQYTFEDLAGARAFVPWKAVPMDLSDDLSEEIVVVGHPVEVYD